MRRRTMINQAIVISDTHCGCQFGLCPPWGVRLDGGGKYEPSELQKKVWVWWDVEFWNEWVPNVTRGEKYIVVVNGDLMDGRHHGSTSQISQNLADQQHIAFEVFAPIAEKCEGRLYITRGTRAHTGESAENEERLAESLKAVPDSMGCGAHNELWLRLGGPDGALAHILHHVGTTGSLAFESTALNKEYDAACSESARWGYPRPDFVIRSHRHRTSKVVVPTANHYGIVEVTPGWQLKTPFTWMIPGARNSTPQCGGILIRQGDEEHYSRSFVRNITRTPEVVV